MLGIVRVRTFLAISCPFTYHVRFLANHVRLLAWECAGTFVYYNVFGNGRQIISIPSA